MRELRNVLERASLLADSDAIERAHLPAEISEPGSNAGISDDSFLDAEHQALAVAVSSHRGTRQALARSLGISERTLYRKLQRHGLIG